MVVQIVGIASYISVEAELLERQEVEQEIEPKREVLRAKCSRKSRTEVACRSPSSGTEASDQGNTKDKEERRGAASMEDVPELKTQAMTRQRRAEVPCRVTCFGTEAKL